MRKQITLIGLVVVALALGGCASAPPAASSTVQVQVRLSEFKIESSLTTFSKGVPYHFVITNAGQVPHELYILPPMSDEGMSMEEIDKTALTGISANDLLPGTTKTLDFTFTDAASPGKLEFACHVPGHYAAGMRASVVVQ